MRRARLPLSALRCFEAAARHLSFTRAGEELRVSQAAISRQVRTLETLLGTPLFERHHRAVRLTEGGDHLLACTSAAFDSMAEALGQIMRGKASGTVRISAEPALASAVLIKHIDDFSARHPDIDLVIESEAKLADLRSSGGTDLALRYSLDQSRWEGCESRLLYPVFLRAVAAPGFLAAHDNLTIPGDLAAFRLLHEYNHSEWALWFAEAGVAPPAPRGSVLGDGGLVLQAALRGQGVALLDEKAVAEELSDGRLVLLSDRRLSAGAYHLVARRFEALSPAAATFAAWIEGVLGDAPSET
ncbi:LysR substrate-binding domain-containing protein [Rhizobium sp. YIM 134829]|uniref:LysR substrate-binding domain-containing protein n=1 Tax=Rhizobium sp. YIM 134829 TaxID=3390453 RepID=UPI00397D4284